MFCGSQSHVFSCKHEAHDLLTLVSYNCNNYEKGGIILIALEIQDIKTFMHKLLSGDVFDSFLLSEASIQTFCTFSIDGHLNKEFFNSDELAQPELAERSMCCWREVRNICFELIKGKKTPLGFKFIFLLSPENVARLVQQTGLSISPDEVNGLFLNIRFERGTLSCTTGTSQRNFTLDKSLDQSWDSMVLRFLKKNEIVSTQL